MTITGLKSLSARLKKKIPAQARSRAKQALAESADEIVALQKSLVPVDSGDLRDSIVATFGGGTVPKYAAFRHRSQGKSRNSRLLNPNEFAKGKGAASGGNGSAPADPDMSVVITAGNDFVRYAHIIEFGSAPHVNGGLFAGSKHPGTEAQPFFYPGYRALRKRVKSRITRAIRKGIKEASK